MTFFSKDNLKVLAIVNIGVVSTDNAGMPRTDENDVDPATVVEPPADASTDRLSDIESTIANAFNTFDRVDNIVTGVATRTDRAKSLWTTVIGTLWQTAWAVFGFVAGLPREVWIVVAVIVGSLMLLYLYRQVILGKFREQATTTPKEI